MKSLLIALILSILVGCTDKKSNSSSEPDVFLVVLGIAQDAGYPQAECYRPHCIPAWEDVSLRRLATSLALIDPVTGQKYLFEATPSMPEQLYRLELEAPNEDFALAGVFDTAAPLRFHIGRSKSHVADHAPGFVDRF